MKNLFNINPYTFTGSAVFIGLLLTSELTLEEQGIGTKKRSITIMLKNLLTYKLLVKCLIVLLKKLKY